MTTLCIGALALQPSPTIPCLVLGFDYKVANEAWGSESEYKFHILSDTMAALFAGAPGQAKELAALYKAHLANAVLTARKDSASDPATRRVSDDDARQRARRAKA